MTTITTAARRIARRLNTIRGSHSGGFCVFDHNGRGGAYYTGNAFPNLRPGDEVRLWVPDARGITQREVQDRLDRIEEEN